MRSGDGAALRRCGGCGVVDVAVAKPREVDDDVLVLRARVQREHMKGALEGAMARKCNAMDA